MLLCTSTICYAQRFGDTEQQIKDNLSSDETYTFYAKEFKKGVPSLVYSSKESVKTFYFNQSGKCSIITILYPKKDLPYIVKINDEMEGNVKIGSLQWFNTNTRIKIEITTIYEDSPAFQIMYSEQ